MPTNINPLVQKVATTQMKNAGTGIEVVLRYPLANNSELTLMLMEQQGNPIGVTFSDPIQARLPAAPRDVAETETKTMSVDGQDAKVTQPKSRGRNGNHADAGFTLHAFEENPEKPGLCLHCNFRPDDGRVHGAAEQTAEPTGNATADKLLEGAKEPAEA